MGEPDGERCDIRSSAQCATLIAPYAGFDIPVTPQGAFYIYAGCRRLADDSSALCLRLLDEAGVAATPGLDFGRHTASTHLRFAYTTSRERIAAAIDRLAQVLG